MKLTGFRILLAITILTFSQNDVAAENEILNPEKIDVYANEVIRKIPDNYLGFSMEKDNLKYGLYNPDNQVLIKLHQNLGKGNLRFGADSTNFSALQAQKGEWDKSCKLKAIIKESEVKKMMQFAKKINWNIIYGINSYCFSPDAASKELKSVKNIAPEIITFEFNNEPDILSIKGMTPKEWNAGEYTRESDLFLEKVFTQEPSAKISGPGIGSFYDAEKWFKTYFSSTFSQKLAFSSTHFYPMIRLENLDKKVPYYPSINHMLSYKYQDYIIDKFKSIVVESNKSAKPVRITEMNSVAHSGKDGVSNVFASAIWFADYAFKFLEIGINGVNVQQDLLNFHDIYSPLHFKAGNYIINPIYYGMLFFANANGDKLVKTTHPLNPYLSVYATKKNKQLNIVLINKNATQDSEIVLNFHENIYKSGKLLDLTGPSLDAKENISFANAIVTSTGDWKAQPELITLNKNSTKLKLAHGSAMLLTLTQ